MKPTEAQVVAAADALRALMGPLWDVRAVAEVALEAAFAGRLDEPTILRKAFAKYLVPAYLADRATIASICDQQLDRTGTLLMYVREAASVTSAQHKE